MITKKCKQCEKEVEARDIVSCCCGQFCSTNCLNKKHLKMQQNVRELLLAQ